MLMLIAVRLVLAVAPRLAPQPPGDRDGRDHVTAHSSIYRFPEIGFWTATATATAHRYTLNVRVQLCAQLRCDSCKHICRTVVGKQVSARITPFYENPLAQLSTREMDSGSMEVSYSMLKKPVVRRVY